jgi:hypothetical protein
MEETGVPRESQRPVASHWQTLSHNVVSSMACHEQGSIKNVFKLPNVVTDSRPGPPLAPVLLQKV